jgi:hypothetical protein
MYTIVHLATAWANAHPIWALILGVTVVCGAITGTWYAIRGAVWPGLPTAKLPTWARVVQALVELIANIPGFVRALSGNGLPPGATPGTSTPATRTGSPGRASVGSLLVVALLAEIALLACPRLPEPSGCTPHAYRCQDGWPQVCSGSQRWTPIGDVACTDLHAACILDDAGVARCALPIGGAQ